VFALALAVAALPLPCLAGDGPQPAAAPGLRASAAKAAATTRLSTTTPEQATDGKAQLASPSFFKTKVGLAVVAVVAVGTGYAFYSISHDHIPARPNRQ
jgi:hypothetical protein